MQHTSQENANETTEELLRVSMTALEEDIQKLNDIDNTFKVEDFL